MEIQKNKKEAPNRVPKPHLEAFIGSPSGTPTFSFYASEGKRLGWEAFCERGEFYKSNGIKTANSVKRILEVECVKLLAGYGEAQYLGGLP